MRKRLLGIGAILVALYAILLVPVSNPVPPGPADDRPFKWNQNERWLALEASFNKARMLGCPELRERIETRFRDGYRHIEELSAREVGPEAEILNSVEENIFQLGPLIGVCQDRLPGFIDLVTRTRAVVKRQSEHWDMNAGKERLYRLLWGGRTALEEVMLQGAFDAVPALIPSEEEPSVTPYTRILGATIHSGDLLVSRGGAPISALVAVGSDFPGNFSHVAIVHVDETTSLPTVVEAGEHGVHSSPLGEYLGEVKLRVMVLRLRADLPSVTADPMLPHRAAALALQLARRGKTPYDYRIDYMDDSRMYCSEVPAWAYRQQGIDLWMDISRISSPGTRNWLSQLGVRRFTLKEPADLEYDPQLRVVAEWRDPHTLYLDHVDNVVTEALLEGASRGDRLGYDWYFLPALRVVKAYSAFMNLLGGTGPIPDGMSATAAGRVLWLNRRHNAIKERVLVLAEEFEASQGYRPPEWQLLRLAQRARDELSP
jgi:hypothetical protein